jgi:hypothetical protein
MKLLYTTNGVKQVKTAARIDRNQPEIVKEFRKLGFSVLLIHQLKNCCDILVARDKFTAAVEIKDGDKAPSARRLTTGEQEFKDNWKGRYYLCESIEDVHEIDRKESAIVKASGLIIKGHLKDL